MPKRILAGLVVAVWPIACEQLYKLGPLRSGKRALDLSFIG